MAIGIGILGAGRWGSHLIRKFLAEPRVRLVAIADPQEASLQQAKRQLADLGESASTIHLTTDWRSLMETPGLGAIVIATPAATHEAMAQAAFERGYHVMVEKPLTLTPDSAYALCAQARRHNRLLVIDHTYLFNPAVETAKTLIESGQLGQIRYGYASRTHLGPIRQDVDALWDLAIHDIAIFNDLLSDSPAQVQAQGQTWLQPQIQTPLSPQGLADTVWARLQYASGVAVQLHLSWLNPDKQRRLVLVGDRAALVFDELAETPLVLLSGQLQPPSGETSAFLPTQLAQTPISVPTGEPLQRACAHFIDCIEQQQSSNRSSGEVGAALVEVLTGLSQSMNCGQAVPLAIPRRG